MSTPFQKVDLYPKGFNTPIRLPDCYTKIAELAFYKAEHRGFEPGHALEDWLDAERDFIEINTKNMLDDSNIV